MPIAYALAMARAAIEMLLRAMQWAYADDPFHALRRNLESVTDAEWDVRPASWSVDEFGTDPELSICDIVLHVAAAKRMYANRVFGDGLMEWEQIAIPEARDMASVLAWLDDGYRQLVDGLTALPDDAELATERTFPYRRGLILVPREQLLRIIINHDLYHSGEINRQRALIRGAEGWAGGGDAAAGQRA